MRWRQLEDRGVTSGTAVLRALDGSSILAVSMYSYAQSIDRGRLLVWNAASVETGGLLDATAVVRFRIINLDACIPIQSIEAACLELVSHRMPVFSNGGVIASTEIPIALLEGEHTHEFPAAMVAIPEVFVLVDGNVNLRRPTRNESVDVRLWVLKPAAAKVQVISQDWFNSGNFDFGYQWVTRVARDPSTGRIVGEGVRLGAFVLDESGRHVERWLIEDVFY